TGMSKHVANPMPPTDIDRTRLEAPLSPRTSMLSGTWVRPCKKSAYFAVPTLFTPRLEEQSANSVTPRGARKRREPP
ncbi:MAG TPA: hypothetical protein VGP82_24265, partial [Ktedonobacterales bacterium]|nr:hypothetical protein [Ktedonobacterales bacterium]